MIEHIVLLVELDGAPRYQPRSALDDARHPGTLEPTTTSGAGLASRSTMR
jgi:hypothetical protein